MVIEQEIESGQIYRETNTERSFKVLEVRPELDQARVLYIEEIERERLVDTRGQSEIKFIDVLRRKLANGSLVRMRNDS